MPSTIRSYRAFEKELARAIADLDALVANHHGEKDLVSIKRQLQALEQWTRGDTAPTLDQKGQLKFGLLASRYLDDLDQELAHRLYDLASYVTYW